MSRSISKIKSLWKRLSKKDYRDSFAEAFVDDRLAAQIHYLRKHRGWTQEQLAQKSGKSQPKISSLEVSCEGVTLNTLKRIASAFDVALSVRFVPFSNILASKDGPDLNATVAPFGEDTPAILRTTYSVQVGFGRMVGVVHGISNTTGETLTLPATGASRGEPIYVH